MSILIRYSNFLMTTSSIFFENCSFFFYLCKRSVIQTLVDTLKNSVELESHLTSLLCVAASECICVIELLQFFFSRFTKKRIFQISELEYHLDHPAGGRARSDDRGLQGRAGRGMAFQNGEREAGSNWPRNPGGAAVAPWAGLAKQRFPSFQNNHRMT